MKVENIDSGKLIEIVTTLSESFKF